MRECSCKGTSVKDQINDFVLVCQPLSYNQQSSIVHLMIKWYIDSTSIPIVMNENEAREEEEEEEEWGIVHGEHGQFYKWPLYQWVATTVVIK